VTASPAATNGRDPFVAAYEELRRRVLAGASFGGHFGLALLLREGIAAWMARGPACFAPAAPAADLDRRGAAPIVTDEFHAGVVRVLASMALVLGGLRELRA
jgi:hypothetical protein